jgi:putative transposase
VSRPPRLHASLYFGCHRYFLTFCTHLRYPRFTEAALVDLVREDILHMSQACAIAVNAYCFMPDHLHLLATGTTANADLKRFVHLTKQRSGWRFSRSSQQRLWQEGYYDRVLRADDGTPAVISYIVNNPLRARLVDSPVDYPFWGSMTHTRAELLSYIQHAGELAEAEGWSPW